MSKLLAIHKAILVKELIKQEKKSPDSSTKVAAIIFNINKNNLKIMARGCNQPINKNEDLFSWDEKNFQKDDCKYHYIIHAEINAIMNYLKKYSFNDLKNEAMIVSIFPCCECAKWIINSKINKIYYLNNKYPNNSLYISAEKLFNKFKIDIEKFSTKNSKEKEIFGKYFF